MGSLLTFPSEALEKHALGGPQPVQQRSLPAASQERLLAIGEAIERVVIESYEKHAMRHRTTAEDARRAAICVGWFNALINQHRWTPDRALSAMRVVLDDELSGKVPAVASRDVKRHGMIMFGPDKTLVH
jgi:hypothetical protein